MTDRIINFGIIGLGRIARRFAEVLTGENVKNAGLVAVASNDAAKAEAFGKEFGAENSYDNYVDLVNNKVVEIVYIANTNNMHFETIKLCLNNGKAVICEKPFVMHKKEAAELAALAAEKNLFLMEAMWTRFLPAYRKAVEWVSSKAIGDLKLIEASFCFGGDENPESRLYNPALGGGATYDVGVYALEFITGIAGKPRDVSGYTAKTKTGVDACSIINLAFDGGVLAQARCAVSVVAGGGASIYGSEGRIKFDLFYNAQSCERFDKHGALVEKFEAEDLDGFTYQIRHTAEMLQQGKKESPVMPISDTIDCAGIFDDVLG